AWERLLVNALRDSAAAWFRLCDRVLGGGESVGAVDRRHRSNAGSRFSFARPFSLRIAHRRNVAHANAFLVWCLRPWIVDLRLGRSCSIADRFMRLREFNSDGAALDHLHVDRSHREYLVWLRLGDPAARDWISLDFSLPVGRSAAVSEIASADFGLLAFSLAWLSNHGRRGLDQAPRRRLLARSHLHVLPLLKPADPESDQPLSAFPAAMVPQTRSALEPFCGIDHPLV